VETKGNVIEELVARVSKEITYPLNYLREGIKEMVDKGILKYEVCEGSITWSWG